MDQRLSGQERELLHQAYVLAARAPRSDTAFAVGSLLAGADGCVLATGYSRELGEHWHAEAVVLHRAAAAGVDLRGATLFSSLEPCSVRKSGRTACCDRILRAGVGRVVFGSREPSVFVKGEGAEVLRAGGVIVVEDPVFDALFREVNAHLFQPEDERPGQAGES